MLFLVVWKLSWTIEAADPKEMTDRPLIGEEIGFVANHVSLSGRENPASK